MAPPPEGDWTALRNLLESIRAPSFNVPIEHRLEEGDPTTEILRVAEEAKSDLIVMNTHGRTGVGRLVLGSVAEHVLRKAPCPVLIVRVTLPEAPVC